MPTLVPHALTTLERVKLFLDISGTAQDDLLTLLINRATATVEGVTGRRLASTEYENELYDGGKDKLIFNQYPVTNLASIEFRRGTISAPTWQAFNANDYLLYGKEGYVQFLHGTLQGLSSVVANGVTYRGSQNIRVTYTAGYLVDFDNEGDETLHNLPTELEGVVLDIVSSMLNVRKAGGVSSESVEGASITYNNTGTLSESVLSVLNTYTRFNI